MTPRYAASAVAYGSRPAARHTSARPLNSTSGTGLFVRQATQAAWLFNSVATVAGLIGLGFALKFGPSLQQFTLAKLIFPWAMLAALRTEVFWNFGIILLFLQFPIYGVIGTIGLARDRFSSTTKVLLLAHAVAAVACFVLIPARPQLG